MRIVAGTARGRGLRAPAGATTRPTSDRVREAVFDILTSMDVVEGAAVVDLFAGSGALGIEALSRGAASAVFVDTDRAAIEAVRANLPVLGDDAARARVERGDATRWARSGHTVRYDVVFADPPYAWAGWPDLLAGLARCADLVVAETGAELDPGPAWDTTRSRRYGSTVVTVARPRPPSPDAEDPTLQPAHEERRGGM
jgi:16S rRNA (guanine966-N2)-methyltransferase